MKFLAGVVANNIKADINLITQRGRRKQQGKPGYILSKALRRLPFLQLPAFKQALNRNVNLVKADKNAPAW